jgi:hypothetical protein
LSIATKVSKESGLLLKSIGLLRKSQDSIQTTRMNSKLLMKLTTRQ